MIGIVAIYVRQSVDKKDSISIETQIETCKFKIKKSEQKEIKIFEDKGFSGKSTNRPSFQSMMAEVKDGNVSKVVVYKLDRISRSLLDFLNIRKVFNEYNTEFISCTEDFDTSTPNGKLMLNMLMAFAEMERETIQKRITDNYYARGKKGYYLGGYAPYGYKKVETIKDGKKTYTFQEVEDESRLVKKIYLDYNNGKSMGVIARELNSNQIPTRRTKNWSANHISRMLKNPLYVKANADVFNYFKSRCAHLNNPIEEYDGEHGCILYGNTKKRTGAKFQNLDTDNITIGMHKGIIDSDLWLSTQYAIKEKQWCSNKGSGQLSWLQGLVKCSCGSTVYVKKYVNHNKTKEDSHFRYFYCRNKKSGTCSDSRKMLRVDYVESMVESAILEKLKKCNDITTDETTDNDKEVNLLTIELSKIQKQIDTLILNIANGSEITAKYLNDKIEQLDKEKNELTTKILKQKLHNNRQKNSTVISDKVVDEWDGYDIEKKKNIAKTIIESITIANGEVQIIL